MLRVYVREKKLPHAGGGRPQDDDGLAAANVGLKDRGVIKPGAFADVGAVSTRRPSPIVRRGKTRPHSRTGINEVWVNGTTVWKDGHATGAYPGKGIRRP